MAPTVPSPLTVKNRTWLCLLATSGTTTLRLGGYERRNEALRTHTVGCCDAFCVALGRAAAAVYWPQFGADFAVLQSVPDQDANGESYAARSYGRHNLAPIPTQSARASIGAAMRELPFERAGRGGRCHH
jgi:hypothetical protein